METLKNRTVETMCDDWLVAKKMVKEAQDQLLEIEKELIAALDVPEEGSKTHRANGFKIELKGVVNRKADLDLLHTISEEIGKNEPFFMPPVKVKTELDESAFKKMRTEMPGAYALLCKAVTATPGKTGVTVTRTE